MLVAGLQVKGHHSGLIETIKSKLDKWGLVGTVVLYLHKAFGTVNHNILLSKLSDLNVSPNASKWIESYLSQTTL